MQLNARIACAALLAACLFVSQSNPVSAQSGSATADSAAFPPELERLYEQLNMRSFTSSYGPRLRYHCESYLSEYFPSNGVRIDSPTSMTLTDGDDTWVVEILSPGRIRVDNYITGSGSYSSTKELDVGFFEAHGDIRSTDTWIERREGCTPLRPEATVAVEEEVPDDGWVCGDLRNPDAAAVTARWRSLGKLPREIRPGRQEWGPRDMLRIDLEEPVSAQDRCEPRQNLLRVVSWPVFDGPDGTQIGTMEYVATVIGGLVNMFGYVDLNDGTAWKIEFDRIAGEQLVMVMADRRRSWLNLASRNEPDVWMRMDGFDQDVFETIHYTFLQRLGDASELKVASGTALPVRALRYPDAEVIYTLRDTGTAILPIDVQQEWMQVRFVAPPEYPSLGCGDDEADYEWITGWIQFRDGDEWFVTEEHHQGC